MKVYLGVVEDRHTDVDVQVFLKLDAAIEYVKGQVQELAVYPEDIVEEDAEGCLYYCRYSVEDDKVYVQERELRE